MKPETKQRFLTACLGAVLSVSAAFTGAGLTGWAVQAYHYGMRTPDMGWDFVFIVFGLIGLVAATPALLVMLVCGIAWHTPLRRHALLSTIVPLFLGVLLIALCGLINPDDLLLSTLMAAGALCLAIAVLVELLLKSRLQGTQVRDTERGSP